MARFSLFIPDFDRRLDRENLRRKQSGNDLLASRHFSCLLAYSSPSVFAYPIPSVLARVTRLSGRYQIGGAIFQGKYPSVIKLSVYRRRRLEPSRVILSTFFSDTVYTCIVCKASSVGRHFDGRFDDTARKRDRRGGGLCAKGMKVNKLSSTFSRPIARHFVRHKARVPRTRKGKAWLFGPD